MNRHTLPAFLAPLGVTAVPSVIHPALNPLLGETTIGDKILDLSYPVEEWDGADTQVTGADVDAMSDEDQYLSLYDLCRGDTVLLDAIRCTEPTPTEALVPSEPAAALNRVAPLQGLIEESSGHVASTSNTDPAPSGVPTPPVFVSPAVVQPLMPVYQATGISRAASPSPKSRYSPYSRPGTWAVRTHGKGADRAEPGTNRSGPTKFGKNKYIKHYQIKTIRPLEGLETTDLNSPQAKGRWQEILVDALEQIGMPYSVHGLKRLIAKAYKLKIIPGEKRHPDNRWQAR